MKMTVYFQDKRLRIMHSAEFDLQCIDNEMVVAKCQESKVENGGHNEQFIVHVIEHFRRS